MLIYDLEYHLWRNGKYLGKGTWKHDKNIGDSFQRFEVDRQGRLLNLILIADKYEWTGEL